MKAEKKAGEVLERMFLSPRLSYPQIVEHDLLENLSGVYEIARVRKLFRDIGSEAFENGGVWREEYGTRPMKFKIKDGITFGSHCDNPDPRYAWTSDYIGEAPEGHPAEGHLIFAKVEGIDEENIIEAGIFGRSPGVIVSNESFAVCDDYNGCMKHSTAEGGFYLDSWIEGFEKRNGLMVPLLSKVQERMTPVYRTRDDGSTFLAGYDVFSYNSEYDPKGFGSLKIDLNVKRPINHRPGGFRPGTSFGNHDGITQAFFVVDKDRINSVLDEK
jgi:hypothetical protein